MPAPRPPTVPASAVVTPVRRPVAAACRALTAAAATTGVTLSLTAGAPLHALSHFTVQSGILLALAFTASAYRSWSARPPLPAAVSGAALLYALITAAVHHLLPAPTPWSGPAALLLHTTLPIAAALDWLLLTTPGRLHLRHAAPWLLYPLTYLALSLACAAHLSPDHVPPYLDPTAHGYLPALSNALLLGLAGYALALLLIALDHTRPNPLRRRAKTGFRLQPPVG
jgi:hypothetical protein